MTKPKIACDILALIAMAAVHARSAFSNPANSGSSSETLR